MRKLIGLWIVIIAYFGSPVAYYFVTSLLNRDLGLPPILSYRLSLLFAAFSFFFGLFWTTWAYSYLHFVGRGSPVEAFGRALEPTQFLVTTGPYAYTRNPMLIGYLFFLLAGGLFGNSAPGVALVVVVAVLALLYISWFEEPELLRRFGEPYERYRESVPPLIPTLTPRT